MATVNVRVNANTKELETLSLVLEDIAGKSNLPYDGTMMLNLALEEAFVNICLYAYPNSEGEVEVSIQVQNENESTSVKITLTDFGVPFNPTEFDDNARSENNLKNLIPGGLGIRLIKQIADNLDYIRTDDKNILSFEKSFGGECNEG